jgi:hypothetical protein
LNLKFLQLLMNHSIWGLGKRCHSWHHLNCIVNLSSWGQLIRQLFRHHIWEFIQNSLNALGKIHQVGSFLWFKFIQHNMP